VTPEIYGTRGGKPNLALSSLISQTQGAATRKIGIINWWWVTEEEKDLHSLKKFVDQQDVCFFYSDEIYDFGNHNVDMNRVFEMLNAENVYYILFSEDLTLSVEPTGIRRFCVPWFFKTDLYVPEKNPAKLSRLAYTEKPYAFNLLLGADKPYRTQIYHSLKSNKNIYTSYLGHPEYKYQSSTFLDDPDTQTELLNQNVAAEKLNTMKRVARGGTQFCISHCVPEKIYRNTHFDLVTETLIRPKHNFLTEKTAKPLATGRFFHWYASLGVIPYLERYGFIFDHSLHHYDGVQNDSDRMEQVIQAVNEVSANPALVRDIYNRTILMRKHNMNIYWKSRNEFQQKLHSWITRCLAR
jgi:hypothetical protein